MKLYGAIDLHSTNNVTVVIDEQDRVVYQKRLPNDLALILKELSVYQTELRGIVVESTYNWYWLVDGLMEQGHEVRLANTAAIQQYEGLKYTDDHSDARWLAHLLRLGVLPQGYIYPKAERPVRDLLRKLLGLSDFDDALDGLLDISQRLFTRFSLRHAPGESRTLSHDVAIFPCGQRNQILVRHVVSPLSYSDKLSQQAFLSQSYCQKRVPTTFQFCAKTR
jgi:transposase